MKFYKAVSRFLNRNFSGQKGVAQYIQSAENKKNFQPKICYLERLLFRFEEEIRSFLDKQKLKELATTKLALEILKGLL